MAHIILSVQSSHNLQTQVTYLSISLITHGYNIYGYFWPCKIVLLPFYSVLLCVVAKILFFLSF